MAHPLPHRTTGGQPSYLRASPLYEELLGSSVPGEIGEAGERLTQVLGGHNGEYGQEFQHRYAGGVPPMGICGIEGRARFTRARVGRGSPTALSKLASRGRRDPMIATIKDELFSMVPSVELPRGSATLLKGERLSSGSGRSN